MRTSQRYTPTLAKEIGINQAIMLEYIAAWVKSNQLNNKNYKDSRYWTFDSQRAMAEKFPEFTSRQIRTIFEKLENLELIYTGTYNPKSYDRTKWYTISEKGDELIQRCKIDRVEQMKIYETPIQNQEPKCQMHLTELSNGLDVDVKLNRPKSQMDLTEKSNQYQLSYQYNNQYNTQHKKRNKKSNDKIDFEQMINDFTKNDKVKESLIQFLLMRQNKKKIPTEHAFKLVLRKLENKTDEIQIEMLEKSITCNYTDIYEPNKNHSKTNNQPKSSSFENLKEDEDTIVGVF